MYAGFLYLTDGGKASNISKAKGIFKNIIIGLFFILTAWLIVNTLLGFLVSDEIRNTDEVNLLAQ